MLLERGVSEAPLPVLHHMVKRVQIPNQPIYNRLIVLAGMRAADGVAVIELLLEQGLDIDTNKGHSQEVRTALHAAIQADRVPNIRCLLDHGARMLRDGEGRTPLELAVHLERAAAAEVLRAYLEQKGLPPFIRGPRARCLVREG